MRIIDRFDEYMNFKHLNDNKVSIQLGLTNGVIGKSRKEGRDLSQRVIEQIENFYTDLNIDWLITGEGSMIKAPGAVTQVIGTNTGTAINGGNQEVKRPDEPEHTHIILTKEQFDELLKQNSQLLRIIENLTNK